MLAILDDLHAATAGPEGSLRLAVDGRPVVIGPRRRACRGGGLYAARLADDPAPLALKLWLPGDGAAEEVEAARAASLSALALARGLRHPGVVRTLGGGVAGGLCWWLSAWVPGSSLDHFPMDEFTPEGLVRMMAEAADALDYVHTRNVVHADLAPANLVWNPAASRPVLLDFGLARRADAPHAAPGLFGTPATMAPERRSGAPASFSTDQYALARTLTRVASRAKHALSAAAAAALARAGADAPADRFPRVADLARALRHGAAPRAYAPPAARAPRFA